MDTSQLEKFCLSITDPFDANGLLAAVRQRGLLFRLDPQAAPAPADADAIDGRILTAQEKAQRAELAAEIAGDPARYAELVRKAAYSWFNRIAAIRYMELHDFLPSHVRMLSQPGTPSGVWARPQCLAEACALDLPGLDSQEVLRLSDGAHDEELFRLLLVAQCAQLAEFMPRFFGRVSTAEALLLPSNLLGEGGLVRRMVCEIPEELWGSEEPDADGRINNQGEVMGWLYQFYIAREKDDAFAGFKKGQKATPEKIGPATQLFTPEWIVRYMVQNSLGRLWMLNNPESKLAQQMEFYIAPEGDPGEFVRIAGPEDITLCDPACGSAHILACAFDLLVEMYRERGYRDRDTARLILTQNLHGMEIDERAAQVAEFVLNMRACSLDRRFFTRAERPEPDVCVLKPVEIALEDLPAGCRLAANKGLLDALAHLTECGSLLAPTSTDLAELREAIDACEGLFHDDVRTRLERALDLCEHLARTYDVVVANPPYMGSSNFDPWTSAWIKKTYPDVKSDLCTCFIERGFSLVEARGLIAMVTASSWMFISSFETMRKKLLANASITSMIQQSTHGFPYVTVPTTMFVLQTHVQGIIGSYIRLEDFDRPQWQMPKALEAIQTPACPWFYRADATTFKDIPGTPIAYWASEAMRRAFREGKPLGSVAYPRAGITTGCNELYIHFWWENPITSIQFNACKLTETGHQSWYPCNKGGQFRKWYGNLDNIMRFDWSAQIEMASLPGFRPVNIDYQLKESISWSDITSGGNSFRLNGPGLFFDHVGISAFPPRTIMYQVAALVNSSVTSLFLGILSPTMHCNAGDLSKVPVMNLSDIDTGEIERMRASAKQDNDSFETSWDFKRHPLV